MVFGSNEIKNVQAARQTTTNYKKRMGGANDDDDENTFKETQIYSCLWCRFV